MHSVAFGAAYEPNEDQADRDRASHMIFVFSMFQAPLELSAEDLRVLEIPS